VLVKVTFSCASGSHMTKTERIIRTFQMPELFNSDVNKEIDNISK